MNRKKTRMIAEEQPKATKVTFDSLAKKVVLLIREEQQNLDAINATKLIQIEREAAKEENQMIDKSQKILKPNSDGKCKSIVLLLVCMVTDVSLYLQTNVLSVDSWSQAYQRWPRT